MVITFGLKNQSMIRFGYVRKCSGTFIFFVVVFPFLFRKQLSNFHLEIHENLLVFDKYWNGSAEKSTEKKQNLKEKFVK